MSAYIVTNETLNNAVSGLMDISRGVKANPEQMFSALLEMNVNAVNQRYDENEKASNLGYVFKRNPMVTKIKAYKELSCLSYQCCEGDVPTCELYKQLESWIAEVAHDIISRLPAYNA